MKAANRAPSISPGNVQPENACVVLLASANAVLTHQLIRALSDNGDVPPAGEARPYQLPIATSVAQARSCVGRAVPSVILLDESIAAPDLLADALRNLSQVAPLVFLAAPENLARLCALTVLADLVTQGRVECVQRHGDFVPLATRLIERHACARPESRGLGTERYPAPAVVANVPERVERGAGDAPLDFGEVLRHEVNNPLTGILGNAELLLSRRDFIPADMVERLEIIAELAIRLRETIRRLSNALECHTARIPAPPSSGLAPTLRHRPPT
ncbi:MAG: hypothetical protein HY234_00400 [Acidobacteria bacterium]|nr:hypothetical protein [Acidobacteriota bacterium]MBI3661501.1 hypothetical protein [Acidobacteriota bacterium]